MESGVLGNALEGVPEEDAAANTSQFEDPEKMTDQEKDQVNEVVTEAFEENFKELEEKKSKAEGSKEEKPADAEDAKKEDGEAEAMEEDEEETEEEEEEEEGTESAGETDEKKEGEAASDEKKEEDEEPSNLQLAWEMLELAKVVFTKQLEAGASNKSKLEERIISTMLALGEVSIENENYKQAVEDIQECLKKQEGLPKDAR